MSDTTYSVKLDEKLKEKITTFVRESGGTAKEFFAKLIEMYEMESNAENGSNHVREFKELENHLSRIRTIYSNLVEEFQSEVEALRDEARKSLREKEKLEEELKNENKNLKAKISELSTENKKMRNEITRLNDEIKRLRSIDENKNALISEYKEKIESLKSSLSKFEGMVQENEKVKKALNDMKAYVQSLESEKKELKAKVDSLRSSISTLRKAHATEIENMKAKSEFERESAMAKEKQICQEKVASLMDEYMKKNEEFSKTLRSLYSEIDDLRDEISRLKSAKGKRTKG